MQIRELDMDSFLNDPRLLVCFALGILCAHLKGRTYTMLYKKEACDLDSAKSCSEGGFGQISETSEGWVVEETHSSSRCVMDEGEKHRDFETDQEKVVILWQRYAEFIL